MAVSQGVDFRMPHAPVSILSGRELPPRKQPRYIPAFPRRYREAKVNNAPSEPIWGRGNPRREFLYSDEMAAASVYVMQLINAVLKPTKPLEAPASGWDCACVSALGWRAQVGLEDGLSCT
jgi:GDP-L-fucose synthase